MNLQRQLSIEKATKVVWMAGLALGLSSGAALGQGQIPDAEQAIAADEVVTHQWGELFGPSNIAPAAATGEGATTVRTISLDVNLMRRVNIGDRLEITPEPNMTELWLVADVERRANGVQVVRMSQPMNPSAMATFVTIDDATAMTMQVAGDKRNYRLQYAGNNQYHVWKFNPGAMTPEAEAGHGEHIPRVNVKVPGDDDYVPEDGFGERDGGGCNNGNPVLDVWLLYTVAARDALGGTTATRAECALAVEHANTAYIGSSMTTRMRLVAATETSYDDSATTQDTDLDRLTGTADGFIDSIHATRDTYNADMVHMITNNGSGLGWCGGTTPDYDICFSVSHYSRVAATFTLAHETGHNLGCAHDRANASGCNATSYAYGHRFFGTDSNGYCTVMAYPDGTYERVLRFSNPNVSYVGTPTGIAIGQPNEAYNAQVIRDTDNLVEDHELTRFDIYVDFGFSGFPAEIGTATFPYNTLPEGITNIDLPNTGSGESPTMYVDAGSTTYTGTISKVMTIVPCGGSVTIGN